MQNQLFISYLQTEELLKKYPLLKSLLHNLQVELESLWNGGKNEVLNETDILYSLAIGNRVLSDMPRSMPSPGEKMLSIILAKDRIINEEYLDEMIFTVNIIGEVVEKITSALGCTSYDERKIIELRYFQDKRWKEVADEAGIDSPGKAGQIRKLALEKMTRVLRITWEQYEFCLSKVR